LFFQWLLGGCPRLVVPFEINKARSHLQYKILTPPPKKSTNQKKNAGGDVQIVWRVPRTAEENHGEKGGAAVQEKPSRARQGCAGIG
jgi:hypothetical protein